MADVNLSTTESLKVGLSDNIGSLSKATSTTLVEYLISGETIFPSGYDLAVVPGDGITMKERSLSDNWLGLQSVNNFTVSGLVIPASSLTLSLTMPLGVTYLAGRYVSVPATVLTFSPSTTSYVFLKVTRDSAGNVTGAWYEVNTTNTPPVDATPVATATTSIGAITATTDERLLGPHGVLILTSGTSWIVKAGLKRLWVEVFGAGAGGAGASGAGAGATVGGNGGNGGTTTFDTISANGGNGGQNGAGTPPAHQSTASGDITLTGKGMPGGLGAIASSGGDGSDGSNGAYAAGFVNVTPAASITTAIGGAGTAGSAGAGAIIGYAGRAGTAGRIVIHY